MVDTDDAEREDESALVTALVTLHRQKARQAVRGRGGNSFSEVVEHFERRSRRLAGERHTTEELIGRVLDGAARLPPRPAAGVLEVTGKLGSKTSACVRVVNASEQAAEVSWVVGAALSGEASPPLTFQPPSQTLAAGQSGIVEIGVDLSSYAGSAEVTIPLECRTADRRDRLQLVIRIEGGQS